MKSIAGALRRVGLTAFAVAAALSSLASAEVEVRSLEERAASGNRLVFAHFMVGLQLGLWHISNLTFYIDWHCWTTYRPKRL